MPFTYRINYNVHCIFANYYDKEIIIHNCKDEWDAKKKLTDYCKKKYTLAGFDNIEIKTIKSEIGEPLFVSSKQMNFFQKIMNSHNYKDDYDFYV